MYFEFSVSHSRKKASAKSINVNGGKKMEKCGTFCTARIVPIQEEAIGTLLRFT